MASSGRAGLSLLCPSPFLGSLPFPSPGSLLCPRVPRPSQDLCFTLLPKHAPFQRFCFLMPLSPGHSIIPPTRCLTGSSRCPPAGGCKSLAWGQSPSPSFFPLNTASFHIFLSTSSPISLSLLPCLGFPILCFFSRSHPYITLGGGLYYHPHVRHKDTEGLRV